MFSGFRIYASRGVVLLFDRASTTVIVLLGLDVCGVMWGVVSVLSLLFCYYICCLWVDLGLLRFDRAMFGDFKKIWFLLRSEVRFGLVTCGDKRK
jgi:hypothetical protein